MSNKKKWISSCFINKFLDHMLCYECKIIFRISKNLTLLSNLMIVSNLQGHERASVDNNMSLITRENFALL